MNFQTLKHIAQQTTPLESGVVSDLIELTKQFPYFAWPFTLLARHYHQKQDFRTEALMHQAALRIHEREWLYSFVHQRSNETAETIEVTTAADASSISSSREANLTPTISVEHPADNHTAQNQEIPRNTSEVVKQSEEIPSEENTTIEKSIPNEHLDIELDKTGQFHTNEVTTKTTNTPKPFVIPKTGPEIVVTKPKVQVPIYDLEKLYGAPETETTNKEIEGKASSDFYSWLNKSKNSETEATSNDKTSTSQKDLIETFLVNKPSITRPKQEFFRPEKAYKKGEQMSQLLVTETLAAIYLKQDNPQKAIWAYEQLQLKFPEKKTYFANLIEQIKKDNLKS